jgi:hypothetical protein
MGPQVWSILKNVHKPSQIAHLKTNGEQWLRFVQTKSYLEQRCAQTNNQNYVVGHGLKEGGAADVKLQQCPP